MSVRLDTERMGNTAGTGFYRDKDGNLKRGINVPDAMWIRLKKFEFIGCAMMDSGSELGAIQSLIAQNTALGNEEIVAWLTVKLEETKHNMAVAEKTAATAPAVAVSEEEKRLAAFARATMKEAVVQIEERSEERRRKQPAPANP